MKKDDIGDDIIRVHLICRTHANDSFEWKYVIVVTEQPSELLGDRFVFENETKKGNAKTSVLTSWRRIRPLIRALIT